MRKVIWKFPINGVTPIEVEENATVLSSGLDPQGIPCVWIMLDPTKEKTKTIIIYLIGTGWEMTADTFVNNENFRFVNTFIEGEYVWHAFAENG